MGSILCSNADKRTTCAFFIRGGHHLQTEGQAKTRAQTARKNSGLGAARVWGFYSQKTKKRRQANSGLGAARVCGFYIQGPTTKDQKKMMTLELEGAWALSACGGLGETSKRWARKINSR
jgi:hypothetical protein